MQVEGLTLSELVPGLSSCALRISTPDAVDHTPTHYVLLIDISESMVVDSKLENVKRCLTILLNFLKPVDTVSLITFGSQSRVVLNRTACVDSTKEQIRTAVALLQEDGATNLSAGLAAVSQVLRQDEKSGLFLLTDGHANRGVHNPDNLREMFRVLKERYAMLSVGCIAYGIDHNAELLRQVAEDTQGKYVIVDSIDSAAFAFGDILGGLLSCCAQMTTLHLPAGSSISGPYKLAGGKVELGDQYSGSKTLLLCKVPTASLDQVRITAVGLPGLNAIEPQIAWRPLERRDLEIELTDLRYTCSSILGRLRDIHRMGTEARNMLLNEVNAFAERINEAVYNDHPIANLLRDEVPVMRAAFDAPNRDMDAIMAQHQTSIGLGRGYTTPMRPRAPLRRSTQPEDPTSPMNVSVFQNPVMSAVGALMRASSQGGGESPVQ